MDQLKPCSANSVPLTPLNFLERAALVYGDCTSIIYNTTTYTWSQTQERCLRLASSLSSLGITRGDVVSIVAPNIPAMYEAHFGVPMCGAVLNTINTRLDARMLSVLLLHGEAKLAIVDYQFLQVVTEAMALVSVQSGKLPMVVLIGQEDADDDGSELKINGLQIIATYEELLRRGDPLFKWVRPTNDWDPMVLNYTSGTTSEPKGVVHCHRSLFLSALDALVIWGVAGRPVYLWTLPMFHANGWSFTWAMAAVGGTNVCLRRFDSSAIRSAISDHKVTHMCGAPVVLNMIANSFSASQKRYLLHPVHILTSGSPPPAAVLLRVEALGFLITHGYGLTETGGVAVTCAWKPGWNCLPAEDRARLKARQGVGTLSMAEVNVVDKDTLKSVPRNGRKMGEIVFRGGCLMLGYLKNPEATAMCMRDGWFFTGDVGVMHPDGYIEIKDRSKDVIISGGENVSSVEVESTLYGHPAVDEAAVVARPDEYWGETPCAFLSLKQEYQGRTSEKEIIAFCRENLPHYMVPKTVVFGELPKTSTGKTQKAVLRQKAKALGSLSHGSVFPSRM
ncbi:2-methylpropanoate--CoA ligase CCL4-like [Nymphaea colorata]|nr:2-methylpropanoate--CoA ligase CCL4-like [Nymphaea colorata]